MIESVLLLRQRHFVYTHQMSKYKNNKNKIIHYILSFSLTNALLISYTNSSSDNFINVLYIDFGTVHTSELCVLLN
jgi:hypothetical protein